MKRIPVIMIFLSLVLYGKAENPPSDKDKAVACIKRWEGWHRGKMPYIGFAQTIDLYFEDNWGNLQQLTYDFNGKEAEEDNNNTEAA